MTTPTPGRIVQFHPPEERGDGPVPAIITKVWGDDRINLTAFFDDDDPLIERFAHVSKGNTPGCWEWPVYA